MIRILNRVGAFTFKFSQYSNKGGKNISQYLKMKKNEQQIQKSGGSRSTVQQLQNAHRLLYIQYFPCAVFALPIIYCMANPADIFFGQCCNLLQYYLSGLLCFNSFFTQTNLNKYYIFIFTIAISNCISGPYSLITPIILGCLNFYAPFTDEKYHKFETSEHEQKIKVYMKIQGVFYFLVVMILTLKFYHFQSIRQFEAKLSNFQEQNKRYYLGNSKEAL